MQECKRLWLSWIMCFILISPVVQAQEHSSPDPEHVVGVQLAGQRPVAARHDPLECGGRALGELLDTAAGPLVRRSAGHHRPGRSLAHGVLPRRLARQGEGVGGCADEEHPHRQTPGETEAGQPVGREAGEEGADGYPQGRRDEAVPVSRSRSPPGRCGSAPSAPRSAPTGGVPRRGTLASARPRPAPCWRWIARSSSRWQRP